MTYAIPRVKLGRTNLSVSRMGCGLLRIGRKWGIDTQGEAPIPTGKETDRFLRGAIDMGVNFFDTAPAYGESEARLGEFLIANQQFAQELIISTKCGKHSRPGETKSYSDYSAPALRTSVENSLRLLGNHIHLLSLHSAPLEALRNEEALRVLEDFKDKGDVDHLGVTVTNSPEAAIAAVQIGIFEVLQVPYNLVDQTMAVAIQLAGESNIGVVTNRPLATGVLTPKFAEGVGDHQTDKIARKWRSEIEQVRTRDDLAQHAWDFVFSNPHVSSVLTGTRSLEHLQENLLKSAF